MGSKASALDHPLRAHIGTPCPRIAAIVKRVLTEQVAAPHPNLLPVKRRHGEKGRAHRHRYSTLPFTPRSLFVPGMLDVAGRPDIGAPEPCYSRPPIPRIAYPGPDLSPGECSAEGRGAPRPRPLFFFFRR